MSSLTMCALSLPDDIRDESFRLQPGPYWRGEGLRGDHGEPARRHVRRVVDQQPSPARDIRRERQDLLVPRAGE